MGENVFRNEKGFTLIEIIAVLIILGILAAVAVPKYIDMQAVAKQGAAQGQVAELKGMLSQAYARAFMAIGNGTIPTGTQVLTNVNATYTNGTAYTVGTAPDLWGFNYVVATNLITINVLNRNGDANYNNTGTWNVPQ